MGEIQYFTQLKRLTVSYNVLTALDLSQNTQLIELDAIENDLTSINLTGLTQLKIAFLDQNELSEIDLTTNSNLKSFEISENQLTALNLTGNPLLRNLNCSYNALTELNISGNPQLEKVYAYENQLTSFSISQKPQLLTLEINNNALQSLNLANGNNASLGTMIATENPELSCIQTDAGYTGGGINWQRDNTANYSANCQMGTAEQRAASVRIYPNPVTDILHIEDAGNSLKGIIIIDATGNTMTKRDQAPKKLDISSYPSGVYYLRTETDTNEKVIKFIKK